MTRVVFLGTPESAVPTLSALTEAYDIGLVVTQPDRPRGRSGTPAPPPVKEAAVAADIPVAQPGDAQELSNAIADGGPFDLGVVVAYGRILRPEVLGMPAAGMLNVHFSLLPRWRGAAPVRRALMAGDTMSGVTIIKLDEGLDTGPVLTAQAVDIRPEDNAGLLTDRLAHLGARLLVSTIPGYLDGELEPIPQVEEGATYAHKLEPEDRILSPDSSKEDFMNKVKGLAPSPGATLDIDGDRHKILAAQPNEHTPVPGTWEAVEGVPVVAIGGAGVEILTLQPPGKTPQSGAAWLRGRHRDRGSIA